MGTPIAFTGGRDALICAHAHALKQWDEIYHTLRVSHALTEICADVLSAKGVDIVMVRRELGRAEKLADEYDENMTYLLSQTDADHNVELDITKLVVVDDLADE